MATIDVRTLGEFIREQRVAAEVSLRQLAKNAGVSNPYLSQVERGLKRPSAEILGQIASALRISAETLYVRAGLLEPRAGNAAVTESIGADETLTERQRQVLLEIYAAFQSENAAAPGEAATVPEPTTTGTTSAGASSPKKDQS
jgi:transcriptional regulator with XRE-family HTH domain